MKNKNMKIAGTFALSFALTLGAFKAVQTTQSNKLTMPHKGIGSSLERFSRLAIPLAKASTLDRLVLIKSLYYFVNGGENGTWPDGATSSLTGGNAPSTDLQDGVLGYISQAVDSVGGYFAENGYSTCASIPTSGTFTVADPIFGDMTLTNATSAKTIPTGWTGAGTAFEKKIAVSASGSQFATMHIHCGTTLMTVALRITATDPMFGGTSDMEFLVQGSPNGTGEEVHLEMISHNQGASKSDIALKFDTTDGDTYSIYVNFASSMADASGNGPALVLAGATGTKSTAKVQLHAQGGDGTGAATASADLSDVTYTAAATPDTIHSSGQACLSTSTGSTTTGCGTVSAPGTPKVGGMTAWTSAAMQTVGGTTTALLTSVASY